MYSTSDKGKNSYGVRRRKFQKKTNFDRKVERVARKVVAKELADEIELKSYDRPEVTSSAVTATGTIYSLSNLIAKGTNSNERVGDKIKIKSVFVRAILGASAAATYNSIRLIVFRWLGQGTPVVGDILTLTTASAIRQLSQLNHDGSRQYQIKYDNTYLMAITTNYQIPSLHIDKFYIKRFGDAEWDLSNNPEHGQVYMLAISDSLAGDAPAIEFTSRVRYTDA